MSKRYSSIIKTSKDIDSILRFAHSCDKYGKYGLSEFSYNKANNLSKFLKIASEEEDEEELDIEDDVDEVDPNSNPNYVVHGKIDEYIDPELKEIATPLDEDNYYRGSQLGLYNYENSIAHNDYNVPDINNIISILSQAGDDMNLGIQRLGEFVEESKYKDSYSFQNNVKYALAKYYKCPSLLFRMDFSDLVYDYLKINNSSIAKRNLSKLIDNFNEEKSDNLSNYNKTYQEVFSRINDAEKSKILTQLIISNIIFKITDDLESIADAMDITDQKSNWKGIAKLLKYFPKDYVFAKKNDLNKSYNEASLLNACLGVNIDKEVDHPDMARFISFMIANPDFQFQTYVPLYLDTINLIFNYTPPTEIKSALSYLGTLAPREVARLVFDQYVMPSYDQRQKIYDDYDLNRLGIKLNPFTYSLIETNPEKAKIIFQNSHLDSLYPMNLQNIDIEKFMDMLIKYKDIPFLGYRIDKIYNFLGEYTYDLNLEQIKLAWSLISDRNCKMSIFSPEEFLNFLKKVNPENLKSESYMENITSFCKSINYGKNVDFDDFQQKYENYKPLDRGRYINDFSAHYVMFGDYNPNYTFDGYNLYDATEEVIKKVGETLLKLDYNFGHIEDVVNLLSKPSVSQKFLSLSLEELQVLFGIGVAKINQLLAAKESIAKSKNYSSIKPNSKEYLILLKMITCNENIRGRDPNIILSFYNQLNSDLANASYYSEYGKFFSIFPRLKVEQTEENLKLAYKMGTVIKTYFLNSMLDFVDVYIDCLTKMVNKYGIIQDVNQIKTLADEYKANYDPDSVEHLEWQEITKTVPKISSSFNRFDAKVSPSHIISISGLIEMFGNNATNILQRIIFPYLEKKDIPKNLLSLNRISIPKKGPFVGFSNYFIQHANVSNFDLMMRIASCWNNSVNEFSTNNPSKKFSDDKKIVREIAYQYNPEDLEKLIQLNKAKSVYDSRADVNDALLFHMITNPDYDFGNEMDDEYSEVLEVYEHGLTVPLPSWASFNESVKTKHGTVSMSFLSRDDVRGLYLGNYAQCCQHLGAQAETCAIDSVVNPKAANMEIKLNNETVAICYTWEDLEGNICLDSIETVGGKAFYKKSIKDAIKQLIDKFGEKQEDVLVAVGSIKIPDLEFENTLENKLQNPSTAWKGFEIIDRLTYSNELYRDDHERQSVIADNRDDEKKEEFDTNYQTYLSTSLGTSICVVCGEARFSGTCPDCGYDPDDYGNCPECELSTIDNGRCINRNCSFTFDICPSCNNRSLLDNECQECGESFEYCDEHDILHPVWPGCDYCINEESDAQESLDQE
jgi:hypothetical protein